MKLSSLRACRKVLHVTHQLVPAGILDFCKSSKSSTMTLSLIQRCHMLKVLQPLKLKYDTDYTGSDKVQTVSLLEQRLHQQHAC